MIPSRPFRSIRLPRHPWQMVLLIALLTAISVWQHQHPEAPRSTALPRPDSSRRDTSSVIEAGTYHVARVIDGDTIKLAEGGERLRLIGADAPETVKPNWPVEPWGPEASQFTKRFLAGGKVRLQFDGQRRDKYGRMLAYVWVADRMLNEELILAGLARAEPQYHYSQEMKSRFLRDEEEARAARRGIWSGAGN